MSDPHPLRTRIVGTLAVVVVVSSAAYLFPSGWGYVADAIRRVGTWLISSVSVPLWLLALMILASLGLVVLSGALAYRQVRPHPDDTLQYAEDVILGIRWRWRFGEMGIYDLVAFCPQCDLQVYPHPGIAAYPPVGGIVYCCENCKWEMQRPEETQAEVENRVQREIQKTLRQKTRDSEPGSAKTSRRMEAR